MTANATRGEVSLTLDGTEYVLRPSYEAISAIETETGCGLFQLAQDASAGTMRLSTAAIVAAHCIRAWGRSSNNAMASGVNPRKIGELILESNGGLLSALLALKLLLTFACTGGYTASGEVKAADVNGPTPAAN